MAEDLTDYLAENDAGALSTLGDPLIERIEIIQDLRLGNTMPVGVNPLREGLDLPEVSLVAILDADKEGFLRGERSRIQTIGRAARHVEGVALLYADNMTDSMAKAISETERRRAIQQTYNEKHGVVPRRQEGQQLDPQLLRAEPAEAGWARCRSGGGRKGRMALKTILPPASLRHCLS